MSRAFVKENDEAVEALPDRRVSAHPNLVTAEGFAANNGLKPIFFDALPWKGKPTRVFAWLGLPEKRAGKVPGIVLVHGGGGTAFKEWARRWNEHGFAALSIAVEGQTDEPGPPGPDGRRLFTTAGVWFTVADTLPSASVR